MQTIAAISTPAGAGAIAIIRMSGDDALAIAARLFSCKELGDFSQAEPRKMYLGTINAGEYADRCLAVRFKAPKTYTGEEIVEFHCHGGARLAREVLAACVACGARVADKGEFTKRAFLAGKLALSDAEAVIDMINAESGAALKASYRMLTGALADEIKAFSDRLLDACASLEASFDYPEEMEDESVFDAKGAVADALEHVEKLLATARTGAMVRDGIDVAIVGVANVGKSSLLNALCSLRCSTRFAAGTGRSSPTSPARRATASKRGSKRTASRSTSSTPPGYATRTTRSKRWASSGRTARQRARTSCCSSRTRRGSFATKRGAY